MRFDEYWPRYVTSCERLRECTRAGYESAWRLHCQPLYDADMDGADSAVMLSLANTLSAAAYGRLTMSAVKITTTGFDIMIANDSGATRTPIVSWIAL